MKKIILGTLLIASSVSRAQITNGLVEAFRFNGTGLSESGNVEFTSLINYGTDRFGTTNSAAVSHNGFYTTISNMPNANEDRTISIWINPSSVNSNNVIFCQGGFGGNAVYGGSFSQTQIFNFTYSGNLAYTNSLTANTWKHIVYTYEGGTIARIYVDGVIASSGPLNLNTGNTAFYLGNLIGGGSSSDAFNGLLDDLAIYDRALSAAEVSTLYNECQLSTSVTLAGTTLTSSSATNAVYQWINCASNTPIAGANAQTYTPTVSGSYAAIVSTGNCSDTSTCQAVSVSSAGIEEQNFNSFNIFPNPAKEIITINNLESGSMIQITDMTGKIVSEKVVSASEMIFDINNLNNGIYFVQLINDTRIIGAKNLVINK